MPLCRSDKGALHACGTRPTASSLTPIGLPSIAMCAKHTVFYSDCFAGYRVRSSNPHYSQSGKYAALHAKAAPGTHKCYAPIKGWLPADKVKAATIFGWIKADKVDIAGKLHQRFNRNILNLVSCWH